MLESTRLQPILPELDTFTVSTTREIGTMAEEWQSLQNACPNSTPFQSVAWASACAEYLGDRDELAIVGARENGLLVGLLPLVRRNRVGVPRLEPLGAGHYGYFGLLASNGRLDVVEALAMHIARQYDAALLHFPYVDVQDQLMTVFLAVLTTRHWQCRSWVRDVSHRVLAEGGFEQYLSAKSRKRRHELRRERRHLEQGRGARLHVYEGTQLGEAVHERLCDLQHRSWLARRGQQTLTAPLWRELVSSLAKAGTAEALLLTVDGDDIAFLLNYRHCGTTYAVMTGFDESWAAHSPGKVMWGMGLERVLNRGDHCLDFLFGDGEYKRFWGNCTSYVVHVVAWRGVRGWLSGLLPYRLHGWVARRDGLRKVLAPVLQRVRARRSAPGALL